MQFKKILVSLNSYWDTGYCDYAFCILFSFSSRKFFNFFFNHSFQPSFFNISFTVVLLLPMINPVNTSTARSTTDFSCPSTSLNITSEGFPVLDALKIVTRSLHNCRVFGYYGGIQKLTALMKGTISVLQFTRIC